MTNHLPVHILETTMRDGSYEIDFQFTEQDTAILTSALDSAGFRYIEVGHGMSVGLHLSKDSRSSTRLSAVLDDDHMRIACKFATHAAVGVILGVSERAAPVEYIDEIRKFGVSFLRLAVFPSDWGERLFRAIERAKRAGFIVSVNLMQTYVLPPNVVAVKSVEAARYGADWFFVVDSAGGMMTSEVGEYVHAVRDASGLAVGLHAHNNSGLAVANCLAAIGAGATLVDSTLNGIGRATGNPPTEQLVLALQARGEEMGLDIEAVVNLGRVARKLYAEKGNDPSHFVSGTALVHSRHADGVRRVARERGRAVSEFMLHAGAVAKQRGYLDAIEYPVEVYDAATELTRSDKPRASPPEKLIDFVADQIECGTRASLSEIMESLLITSRKRRKHSVLHLVKEGEGSLNYPLPWASEECVGVSVPYSADSTLLSKLDSKKYPDLLIVDEGIELTKFTMSPIRCFTIPFRVFVAEALVDLILAVRAVTGGSVWIPEDNGAVTGAVKVGLSANSIPFKLEGDPSSTPRIIVASPCEWPWVDALEENDFVLMLGYGHRLHGLVDQARAKKATVLSVALAEVVSARASTILGLARRLEGLLTPVCFEGVRWVDTLVAPGVNEIVVDDTATPSKILDMGECSTRSVINAVASARVRTLLSGSGCL